MNKREDNWFFQKVYCTHLKNNYIYILIEIWIDYVFLVAAQYIHY